MRGPVALAGPPAELDAARRDGAGWPGDPGPDWSHFNGLDSQ
jgi:hypothetical protein